MLGSLDIMRMSVALLALAVSLDEAFTPNTFLRVSHKPTRTRQALAASPGPTKVRS